VERRLQQKDPQITLDILVALDSRYRELKTKLESLLTKRNASSKAIGEKKRLGEDLGSLMSEMGALAQQIKQDEEEFARVQTALEEQLANLPNLPIVGSPVSANPQDNVCLKTFKEKPHFAFSPKNHLQLNENLHLFDFTRAAKISGSGWPAYCNSGARLEWALINYMIDTHIKNGFVQWIPPLLVREAVMFGCGQFPKFQEQVFKLSDDDYPLYLIPTAEAALNGLHSDEILDEAHLPLKYVAYTPCFRREAGAAGSQERGLIRVHQFNKVEMFCFATPEQSPFLFDSMVESAEKILQGLNLHYRNMLLVTGDMSWSAAKTVDIEVWLPGQNRYYEVSSVSNCTDFQARRSQIRYRGGANEKTEFVHTLNGSGLATSRLMVALLENNQQADGSVLIPEVLRNYLGGMERLIPH
jgi:seryl-tRNA synthetase